MNANLRRLLLSSSAAAADRRRSFPSSLSSSKGKADSVENGAAAENRW
jgi:hypothetical protein